MGYELTPRGDSSLLRVFIDYAIPETPIARSLGRVLGGLHARWCTRQMAGDAEKHFRISGEGR